jgi:hypothetical protein
MLHIPFHRCSWVNTISWLSNLSKRCSLHSLLTRLILLATVVYYIGRERNSCLHGDAPHTSSMIYGDIVSCIVLKINHICNMASLITNRRLHITCNEMHHVRKPINHNKNRVSTFFPPGKPKTKSIDLSTQGLWCIQFMWLYSRFCLSTSNALFTDSLHLHFHLWAIEMLMQYIQGFCNPKVTH